MIKFFSFFAFLSFSAFTAHAVEIVGSGYVEALTRSRLICANALHLDASALQKNLTETFTDSALREAIRLNRKHIYDKVKETCHQKTECTEAEAILIAHEIILSSYQTLLSETHNLRDSGVRLFGELNIFIASSYILASIVAYHQAFEMFPMLPMVPVTTGLLYIQHLAWSILRIEQPPDSPFHHAFFQVFRSLNQKIENGAKQLLHWLKPKPRLVALTFNPNYLSENLYNANPFFDGSLDEIVFLITYRIQQKIEKEFETSSGFFGRKASEDWRIISRVLNDEQQAIFLSEMAVYSYAQKTNGTDEAAKLYLYQLNIYFSANKPKNSSTLYELSKKYLSKKYSEALTKKVSDQLSSLLCLN